MKVRDIRWGKIILAIVVVILLFGLIGFIWLSQKFSGTTASHRLLVRFDHAAGLQRGAPVTVRGVKVGKVLDVYLKDKVPMVVIGLAKGSVWPLPQDSKVMLLVSDKNLLFARGVEIELGTSRQVFAEGDSVTGTVLLKPK